MFTSPVVVAVWIGLVIVMAVVFACANVEVGGMPLNSPAKRAGIGALVGGILVPCCVVIAPAMVGVAMLGMVLGLVSRLMEGSND